MHCHQALHSIQGCLYSSSSAVALHDVRAYMWAGLVFMHQHQQVKVSSPALKLSEVTARTLCNICIACPVPQTPLQGLAPLVDVREVEQCILGVGGTVNYKHFYEPEAASDCSDGDGETGL